MKKLFLFVGIVALFSVGACGQSSKNVPADVKTSFSQKFPKAINAKWDKEDENVWEVEFKMDNKSYSANFDLSGVWLETEYEIEINLIPSDVKATLDSEFAGYKIKEPEVSETAEGTIYEFQLKKGDEVLEVGIDASGKVVSRKDMEEEGDEEKD